MAINSSCSSTSPAAPECCRLTRQRTWQDFFYSQHLGYIHKIWGLKCIFYASNFLKIIFYAYNWYFLRLRYIFTLKIDIVFHKVPYLYERLLSFGRLPLDRSQGLSSTSRCKCAPSLVHSIETLKIYSKIRIKL